MNNKISVPDVSVNSLKLRSFVLWDAGVRTVPTAEVEMTSCYGSSTRMHAVSEMKEALSLNCLEGNETTTCAVDRCFQLKFLIGLTTRRR